MKKNISQLFVLSVISAMIAMQPVNAGPHNHVSGKEIHEEKGPNGGKLLHREDIELEITIYESGIPPEMRIYVYKNGQLLTPENYQLNVTLDRLGGRQDQLRFSAETDYQVGDQIIVEPHSYDVTVNLSIDGKTLQWQYDSHEGRAEIPARLIELSGIETEPATAQRLIQTDTLFGVISAPADKVFNLSAPYSSLVQSLKVQPGDKVKKGQTLAILKNTDTLQNYALKSPANGEVTAQYLSIGERAGANPVLQVSDLSTVWVDMSAFPENIEKLALGQKVTVYDMHDHENAFGTISYVAPQMTGGHIARARATIDNSEGHWRPGMHVKANVEVANREMSLAVKTSALQSFRDMPVVFARYGNTFEVRMIEMGEQNDEWIEVLGGLEPGTEYVTGNSFLLKADVLKDGASHDH
jgi:cobalt-zinc-cadmium efflux system membrane fusion protein